MVMYMSKASVLQCMKHSYLCIRSDNLFYKKDEVQFVSRQVHVVNAICFLHITTCNIDQINDVDKKIHLIRLFVFLIIIIINHLRANPIPIPILYDTFGFPLKTRVDSNRQMLKAKTIMHLYISMT